MAASATAEKKIVGQRSCRIATPPVLEASQQNLDAAALQIAVEARARYNFAKSLWAAERNEFIRRLDHIAVCRLDHGPLLLPDSAQALLLRSTFVLRLEIALNEPVAVTAIVLIVQGLVEAGVVGAEALHIIKDRLRIEGVRLSESGHLANGGDLFALANVLTVNVRRRA